MVFMIPEIPKFIQFSLYRGVHFLRGVCIKSWHKALSLWCSEKSGFTVLTSTLKLLKVLTTILFVYVTLHFFHHYAFNVSWSEIVILIFKSVDKILHCYHGLPIWHILLAFIYFCCQKKIMLIFFLNPHEQLNNVSFQY